MSGIQPTSTIASNRLCLSLQLSISYRLIFKDIVIANSVLQFALRVWKSFEYKVYRESIIKFRTSTKIQHFSDVLRWTLSQNFFKPICSRKLKAFLKPKEREDLPFIIPFRPNRLNKLYLNKFVFSVCAAIHKYFNPQNWIERFEAVAVDMSLLSKSVD